MFTYIDRSIIEIEKGEYEERNLKTIKNAFKKTSGTGNRTPSCRDRMRGGNVSRYTIPDRICWYILTSMDLLRLYDSKRFSLPMVQKTKIFAYGESNPELPRERR